MDCYKIQLQIHATTESLETIAIQLFLQRLSHKSLKVYTTMPISIMGSKSLGLPDWSLNCLRSKEEESMNERVSVLSFYHAETPWGSVQQP